MEKSNRQPDGSSLAHKAAAAALAVCSLIAGFVIYQYFAVDGSVLRDCISRGGSGSTCSLGGSWRVAIPIVVVLGGLMAAAKVWRGSR